MRLSLVLAAAVCAEVGEVKKETASLEEESSVPIRLQLIGVSIAADKDGDGKLTEAEVKGYARKIHELRVKTSPHQELFSSYDKDQSGSLSLEEIAASMDEEAGHVQAETHKFAGADANGDGGLSLEEFEAHHKYEADQTGPVFGSLLQKTFGEIDSNGDGSISSEEYQKWVSTLQVDPDGALPTDRLHSRLHPTAVHEGMEAARDAKVTAQGVTGAAARKVQLEPAEIASVEFGVLDRNGDGSISAQELQHYMAGDTQLEHDLSELMKQSDLNGDGAVDQAELFGSGAKFAHHPAFHTYLVMAGGLEPEEDEGPGQEDEEESERPRRRAKDGAGEL
mmetsp:Transcript_34313/g.74991  ORF Transcript_34313/g.74991 Transcript_34313/m.74991 type:complete len:337 (+) Transcript_34313:44-1054(+)|eukprot:CAMPEP_0204392518 /NCGR_PEP_ID=MMETSP0469-20131031/61800_1 /ASSEMBLY_ACC=CAM_ASM_000384 /TAXON_ID=2969 /ORGANISM="Oxyrrhis marina" /LENGTH=336 /DNA_ID=CAMNT_0051386497 /DNA_START=32 /DNA_END=1042 /DNA_ORIENTATION=+